MKDVTTQLELKAIANRKARLDAFAISKDGKRINIEVQKTADRHLNVRARYYSSMIDSNMLDPGDEFDEMSETYVIFITKIDYFGLGLPAYLFDRQCAQADISLGDGSYIIFINGQYDGDDPIGNLMHDFKCRGANDMRDPKLAERMRFLKETQEGNTVLDGIDAKIEQRGIAIGRAEGMAEGRAEGMAEGRDTALISVAKKMLRDGTLSLEQITNFTGLQADKLQELRAGI